MEDYQAFFNAHQDFVKSVGKFIYLTVAVNGFKQWFVKRTNPGGVVGGWM